MNKYTAWEHMQLVPFDNVNVRRTYYLPHNIAINNHSMTTKLQVVFNASTKSSNG